MRTVTMSALCLLMALLTTGAHAQSDSIYLIKIFDCPHKPVQRSQTGFRIKGLLGIVTALHGVIDSPRIMAQSDSGRVVWRNLKIAQVDISHDLALLSSDDLKKSPLDGLTATTPTLWQNLMKVHIVGHPFGIAQLNTDLTVRRPPIRKLHDLVPVEPLSKLLRRRSPDPDKDIVSLDGAILPGDSGAPILDLNEHLIAVANGGLQIGSNITWAIPYQEIRWNNLPSPIPAILLNTSEVLFDVEDYVPPTFPIKASQHDTGEDTIGDGHHMTTDVTILADGGLTATTKIENKVALNGFGGAVAVFLLDKDDNIIRSIGPGSPFSVGSVRGSQLGIDSPSTRMEQWSAKVPAETLCRISKITIVHTPKQKNPFDLLTENTNRIRKSATGVKVD